MEDKRLIKRLTDYWNRLRGEKPLPQWEKFNIAGLMDIWGQCCVWKVDVSGPSPKNNHYTYEYVGEAAKEALGIDLTGIAFISNNQNFPAARISGRVDEAVQSTVPITDEGTFVNETDKIVKYRSCLLPFGTAKGRVTHIILGLSWKVY